MPKGDRLKLKDDSVPYSDHTSYRYQRWRNKVSGGNCILCGRGYSNTQGIELVAHHIWPMAEYPELRYDPDNGIILCPDCHKFIHAGMKNKSITIFDVFVIKQEYEERMATELAQILEKSE